MTIDQDAETLRDALADAYGRGTATYDIHLAVLDRILTRIARLEAIVADVQAIEGIDLDV